jgi:RNA polymerase sigma-70 factor, ECF subfamily
MTEATNIRWQTSDPRRAETFLSLYSSCQRSLYAYIVMLLGDPIDAHDVLQDTALILWQKFDAFELGTKFSAWAREVARYRVLRYRQIHANDEPMFEPHVLDTLAAHAAVTEPGGKQFRGDKLAECIDRLGEADRELIRLRYLRGVRVKTLAESLQRSEKGVSQSLGRIRRNLRRCIEDGLQKNDAGEVIE